MKKSTLSILFLIISICSISQYPQIKWGEEFKLRKASTDLEVMYADKSGVYLQEGHLAVKTYFVIGVSARASATLVKLDNNLVELYHNDFNKELKGKEFEQFFMHQDKMLIIASLLLKREGVLEVYGAEIDKNTGKLAGDWQLFTSFNKEDKKDNIKFRITTNADSSKIVVVSSVEGKGRNEYRIQQFEKSLKPAGKPVVISNEFEPKTYQLEDVVYTTNRKILLVGRLYEFQDGKRKKEKYLDFLNYNIRMYNEKGEQQKEVNTNIDGKWLTSTKLVQEKDKDLVLAAFFNNNRKSKTIDGMLVQRINSSTGEVMSTSQKEINHSLLSLDDDESEEENDESDYETKAERKERERLDKIKNEGEAFSRYMKFHDIIYTADNGLIIVAEKYHHYIYSRMNYSQHGSHTTTYAIYECGDVMMSKIDDAGNIGWMQVVPKKQREVSVVNHSNPFSSNSFFDVVNRPFYAGFSVLSEAGSSHLIFNDHPKNALITQAGQKVKLARRFHKSDCFMISVDQNTGRCSRKQLFSNVGVPTSMPRLGTRIGKEMYIVGKEDRLLGKSKIAVAKLSMK